MTATGRGWLPVTAVAVSVVLWSTTYGLSELVLVTASPAVLSELRLMLAVPPLVALIALRRGRGLATLHRALRRPATVLLALTGVSLFYLPSNIGLALSTAGTASLMSASLPVLTALAAWWLIRERTTARVIAGLAITTVGIVVASAGAVQFGPGALLLVAGLASYAVYTVLLRRLGTPAVASDATTVDAVVLATATAIWGAVLLLPWLVWEVLAGVAAWPADGPGWTSILFLALVVTGPTMALFSYGAERVPAAVAGTATGAVPALGYAFAVALGEPLDAVKVIGGVLALIGIVVAATPPAAGIRFRLARNGGTPAGASHETSHRAI